MITFLKVFSCSDYDLSIMNLGSILTLTNKWTKRFILKYKFTFFVHEKQEQLFSSSTWLTCFLCRKGTLKHHISNF